MRFFAMAAILTLGTLAATGNAAAQAPFGGDIALSYHYVRANTPAGQCGCFALNGGSLSGSYNIIPHLAVVAEVESEVATSILQTNKSLTLTAFTAGGRVNLSKPSFVIQPFLQILIGGGHAGGGIAAAGDGNTTFVTRYGGGVDLPLHSRIVIRGQVDYYRTQFNNTVNNSQNNLLVGVGVSYRFRHSK